MVYLSSLIKAYLESLIECYCIENFALEEYELIVDECIDHKKLNELSKKIARKLLQDSDTAESQFKKLTDVHITDLIKINS